MRLINQIPSLMKKVSLLSLVVSSLGVLFFIYLFYSEFGHFPSSANEIPMYIISILIANTSGLFIYFINSKLNKIIEWKKFFFTRFVSGFILHFISTSLVVLAFSYLITNFFMSKEIGVAYNELREEVWKLGILVLITLFIYQVFYGWFYSYRYFASAQIKQLQQDRHQMELQFESLKSQISPHYLFNCLNTISSLLYKDSEMAEEFIRRMADTFRYVMGNQKKKLVTVREEIEFVKSYYYLLQVRYHHDLKMDINLPQGLLSTLVPPLAIQMLIENAVKHNEISKKQPLFIYISAQDNTFINISSTKTTASQAVQSFQIGLNNIKRRYLFFTPEKIVIKNDDKFVVQLPVLQEDYSKIKVIDNSPLPV